MQLLEEGNRSDNILKNINYLQIQMVLRVFVMKT